MKLLERNKLRLLLEQNGINARGLSDDEIKAEAAKINGDTVVLDELPVKPARKPIEAEAEAETAPTKPALKAVPTDDDETVKKIAELIADLKPATTTSGLDEQAVIDLIRVHAVKREIVSIQQYNKPTIEIEGAHNALPKLVKTLLADCMPYLCGPAGSGKTTLAIQAATALSLDFYSTGAVSASYELIGHNDANGNYIETSLRKAFEHGGVFLFDEIDACSAKALVTINQLLANDFFTFPDAVVAKHPDFKALAAANTVGNGATRQYVGRNPLDGASLDRFIMLDIAYDEVLELDAAVANYKSHGGPKKAEAINWVTRVQVARQAALELNLTAIISPRASIKGCALLAHGFGVDELDDMILFKGLSDDVKRQLAARMA